MVIKKKKHDNKVNQIPTKKVLTLRNPRTNRYQTKLYIYTPKNKMVVQQPFGCSLLLAAYLHFV